MRRHSLIAATAAAVATALALVVWQPAARSEKPKAELPAEVEAILADKPCFTCHGIGTFGTGKLGPNLDTVGERRDGKWLRAWITNPRAVKSDTMMPAGLLEGDELDTMVAFLSKRKANVAANAVLEAHESKADAGKVLFDRYDCDACHKVRGAGGNLANTGPDLKGVGDKYDADYLRKWLADPAKVKEGTFMPDYDLSKDALDALVAYLLTL